MQRSAAAPARTSAVRAESPARCLQRTWCCSNIVRVAKATCCCDATCCCVATCSRVATSCCYNRFWRIGDASVGTVAQRRQRPKAQLEVTAEDAGQPTPNSHLGVNHLRKIPLSVIWAIDPVPAAAWPSNSNWPRLKQASGCDSLQRVQHAMQRVQHAMPRPKVADNEQQPYRYAQGRAESTQTADDVQPNSLTPSEYSCAYECLSTAVGRPKAAGQ